MSGLHGTCPGRSAYRDASRMKKGVLLLAGALFGIAPGVLPAQRGARPQPPACSEPTAGKRLPTVDDVLQLRGEKLARTNPFGAYDLSRDGSRIAVQIRRPIAAVRAHATSSFFWLHADVGVYDPRKARRIGFLDGTEQGDSWAAPFWSPDGRYLAVVHVGPASLDRQMYV